MTRSTILGSLLALCLVVSACGTASSTQSACAASAPAVDARPAQAAPGKAFQLHGENFAGRYVCNDVGPNDGEDADPPRGFPEQGILIEFVQGGRTWNLGTVDSDENLSFDTRLEVPNDAKPGRATVRATNRNYGPTGTRLTVSG